MTENEAIEDISDFATGASQDVSNMSLGIAIKALEEIQQYHAIGTVEECRAAMEKQTAKLVINNTPTEDGVWYQCPACKGDLTSIRGFYCGYCGQKLDWG